ncbi:MAG TPA: DUF4350 domain-containing protein [Steroidobacteraceae bacterium]|jgi:hypothetical protein|nr:DUF4350 domain-containing protein [Steroidobacteraceae bacterium]
MRERAVTLALALAALVMFCLLLLPKPAPEGFAVSQPLSTDSGSDGYLGARRWLQAGKVPVQALHDRYDRLDQAVTAASGNVLLVVMPQQVPERPSEEAALDRWLRQGNSLVVMAALDDTPPWSLGKHYEVGPMKAMTSLEFRVRRLAQGKDSYIEPRGPHPLLEGVHSVHVVSVLPTSQWSATATDGSAPLEIGRLTQRGDSAIWLARRGLGQVIVLAAATPFTNAVIGDRDNARLLSNLIAWSRLPAGIVLFDDGHQGALSEYDAAAFFRDPRLHWTLVWIVLLWLAFVVGIQPLRSRTRDWNPIDITSFIAMSGEFLASVASPAATGTRLMRNFFDGLNRRLNRPEDGAPAWDWLSQHAGIRPEELEDLERLHARAAADRRVDLVRLQTLLSKLQGTLV